MSIKSLFENIADAIRETSGSSDTYTPAEMPNAIRNFNSIFQTKNLSTPIEGQTTVEGCLSALSEKTDLTYNTVSGNPISFTTDSAGISRNTIVTLEPIQSGSGDPSPTNVRPISGYDFVTVANQDGTDRSLSLESGALGAHGVKVENATRCILTDFIPLKKGELVHLECTTTLSKTVNIALMLWSNNTYGSNDILHDVGWGASSQTYYAKQDGYIMATVRYSDSSNISPNELTMKMMNASSITSPLPSTIYGGTYDVETGELTVNYAIEDFANMSWIYSSTGAYFYSHKLLNVYAGQNIVCSNYKYVGQKTQSEMASVPTGSIASASVGEVKVKNTDYTDAATFQTAMTGVKLAYELSTPYTIQLKPHLLPLLSGVNTVSTNGSSIEVTYRNGLVARVDDFSAIADAINTIVTILENSNNT